MLIAKLANHVPPDRRSSTNFALRGDYLAGRPITI
jgi:hypothetical protein